MIKKLNGKDWILILGALLLVSVMIYFFTHNPRKAEPKAPSDQFVRADTTDVIACYITSKFGQVYGGPIKRVVRTGFKYVGTNGEETLKKVWGKDTAYWIPMYTTDTLRDSSKPAIRGRLPYKTDSLKNPLLLVKTQYYSLPDSFVFVLPIKPK